MKKSTVRKMMIATAFVVLFLSAGESSAQTSCSKTTDAEFVAAVKAQFETDAEIKAQMRHVNVSVKNRRVTLEGWLDGKALVSKAVALARKTKCVRKVDNRLKETGGGSCGPGQKPCGDICIDARTECTIVVNENSSQE